MTLRSLGELFVPNFVAIHRNLFDMITPRSTKSKNISYSIALVLMVLMGFSFVTTDSNINDMGVMQLLSPSEDSLAQNQSKEISKPMLDSINNRLDYLNRKDAGVLAEDAPMESKTMASTITNIRTGMRSAKIHKVNSDELHGVASYYHDRFAGRKTANGEIFSQSKYTCACNSLPLGTYVKVTNKKNGKEVVVKVNDRLAKYNKRVVDLSKCSARKIGSVRAGLAKVKVEVIDADEAKRIISSY